MRRLTLLVASLALCAFVLTACNEAQPEQMTGEQQMHPRHDSGVDSHTMDG